MSEETPAAQQVPLPDNSAGVQVFTEECPECGETFTGPKAGGRGAAFQLARHRKAVHKVQGRKQQDRAAAAEDRQTPPDPEEPRGRGTRVLSAVTEIGDAVGKRKGVPSADDLGKGLGRGLGLSTTALASFVVESDPHIEDGPVGDQIRDALIKDLSLDRHSAEAIMRPVGRALAPTALNRKYGRAVVENVDLAASISELGILAMHWRKYLRMRSAATANPTPQLGGMIPPAPAGGPAPWPATHDPDSPPPTGAPTTPAPINGIVVTPEMVAAMQRERDRS